MGCPAGLSGTTSFPWAKSWLTMMTIKWQRAEFCWLPQQSGYTVAATLQQRMMCKAAKLAAGFARSACGNDATYTIEGKSYQVSGFCRWLYRKRHCRMVWRGIPRHGNSGLRSVRYVCVFRCTPHLPLPSFVRVTHQQNGKNTIVRINDRGPFEGGDLIQLSFAAANALGITQKHGAPVKLEALSPEQFKGQLPADLVAAESGSDGRSLDGSRTSSAAIRVLQREKQPLRPMNKSKVYYIVAGRGLSAIRRLICLCV